MTYRENHDQLANSEQPQAQSSAAVQAVCEEPLPGTRIATSATRASEAAPAPDLTLAHVEAAIASIGERIRARRKLMGLTLDQLAERAGMSKSYVWEIENGEHKNPTIRTAFLIARALGWTLSGAIGVWEHADLLHPEAMRIAMEVDVLLRTASADTLPKGQDAQQGLVRSKGSAVPKADAQVPHD